MFRQCSADRWIAPLTLVGTLLVSGCSPYSMGVLYTDSRTPVSVLDAYPWSQARACGWTILGIVSVGDFSVRSAMERGKLGRAALVETEVAGAIGIFRVCTIVHGPYDDLGPPPT